MKDMPVVDEQASREPYTKFDTQVITYDLDKSDYHGFTVQESRNTQLLLCT